MFLLHIKTAFRYLKSHLQFAIVNLLGLTLGFFCFFLLTTYVLKETSFDLEHNNIVRLIQNTTDENGKTRQSAAIAPKAKHSDDQ